MPFADKDDKNVTNYQTKRFSTFTNGLRELSEWLCSNSCKDVCMESTGKLMTVIYHILKDKVCYDERLYSHYNQLPTSKEITTEQAIALAKRQGYKIVC